MLSYPRLTIKKIGLINYLYVKNEIDHKIFEFIQIFTKSTSSNSIANTKKIMYNSMGLDKKLEKAAELNALTRMHSDFKMNLTLLK